jgi:hypothetical protein
LTLREILITENFNLPIERGQGDHFYTFTKSLLTDYYNQVQSSKNLYSDFKTSPYIVNENVFKLYNKEIYEKILESLSLYFTQGKTYDAFLEFKTLFDTLGLINQIGTTTYSSNTSFFRIRKLESNYALQKKELFHIPFNSLEKVSTQRFSLPGYPCLYLGNSIYVCWEELNRPSIEKIQISRFENSINIPILNFDWSSLLTKLYLDSITDDELFRLGLLWPIFAVSSIRVPFSYIESPFKPEYIFPQFIAQIISSNLGTVHGIRYCSTKPKYNHLEGNSYYNIVFPVRSFETTGYCKSLLGIFKSTNVVSWNLLKFMNDEDNFKKLITSYKNIDLFNIAFDINKDLTEYSKTEFFKIEAFLKKQTVDIIDK